MAETELEPPIYEERPKTHLTRNDGKSDFRTANFLKPLAKHGSEEADGIPSTPLLSEIFPQNIQNWPSKVVFKGWRHPQKKWSQWVDRLVPKYGSIWKRTGIYNAVMGSVREIRCNPELVLGLSEFWCPSTNTFVFPWGEATVTLEDVMVLGGFPVMGKLVTSMVPEKSMKMEEELKKRRREICRSRAKKAGHCNWLKQFMEEEAGTEFEHLGFLSLWLSRFVFPSVADETLGKHVFPIAINLSQGKQMAIAPAVLASLYRDLTSLHVRSIASEKIIAVSAPFQLLQLWAFEHFPILAGDPNSLKLGEPRIARWHKLNAKINLPLVRSTLKVADNFQWRPYAANVRNWRYPSYYRKFQQWWSYNPNLDPGLKLFFKFLQGLELVGVDCKEKYSPQRVAMQFGLDQDIPAKTSKSKLNGGRNVGFFIPEITFVPGVSRRYSKWWTDMMFARSRAVKDLLLQEKYTAVPNRDDDCKHSDDAKKVSGAHCDVSSDSEDDEMVLTSRLRVLGLTNRKKKSDYFAASTHDDIDHMPLSKRLRMARPYTESSGSTHLDLWSGNEEASSGIEEEKKVNNRGFVSSLEAFTGNVETKPADGDELNVEAGEFFDKPIDVDAIGSEETVIRIDRRLKRLEKLVGLVAA